MRNTNPQKNTAKECNLTDHISEDQKDNEPPIEVKVEKEKHKKVVNPFGKSRIVSRRAQADFLEGEAVYSAGKNESNKPAPTSAIPR